VQYLSVNSHILFEPSGSGSTLPQITLVLA